MKLKLIALAVAGLAAAGSANAALNRGISDYDGNAELFAIAYDGVGNIQGFFDLGVNITDFTATAKAAPGITNTWNFAANTTTGLGGVTGSWSTAWNTFSAGSTAPNTQWMVGAFEMDALAIAMTTSSTNPAIVASQQDALLLNFPATDTTIGANTNLGNHSTVANGANTAAASSNPAGVIGSQFAPNWNANFVGSAFSAINTAQNAYFLAANFQGGSADVTQYAGQFNLSSAGVLSYTTAPVPEPETYALMLAGLGMVGLIARRRRVV